MAADSRSSEVAPEPAPQGVQVAVELALRQQVPAPEPALRLTGPPVEEELPAWQEAAAQSPS